MEKFIHDETNGLDYDMLMDRYFQCKIRKMKDLFLSFVLL